MPFTGSHPAAVLPLARGRLVPSALVLGSMVPDLPYFIPVPASATLTHSIPGAVTVDVLLGGAVFVLWHGVLARPAVAAAPPGLRARLGPRTLNGLATHAASAAAVVRVAVSLAVGALTHVVWDAFTHERRTWWSIGWLAERHGGLSGYRWAQYTSSVVGAVCVGVWLWRWWRRTPAAAGRVPAVRPVAAVAVWASIVLAAAAAAFPGVLRALTADAGPDVLHAGFLTATRGGAAGAAVGLVWALAWHLRRTR